MKMKMTNTKMTSRQQHQRAAGFALVALLSTIAGTTRVAAQAFNSGSDGSYGPLNITLQKSGGSLEIIWQAGTLQWADDVTGPYTNVPGATAPYSTVTPSAAKKFYRVQL